MAKQHKKRQLSLMKKISRPAVSLLTIMSIIGSVTPAIQVYAADKETKVFINEIESNDSDGGEDWVEIINEGTTDVDISNWFVTDDKNLDRLTEGSAWRIPEGSLLKAGSVLVLEEGINFDFGLGKNDSISLYDGDSNLIDTYSYTGHAVGTYSRTADGTFIDAEPTKGALNKVKEPEVKPEVKPEEQDSKLVINEVNSSPDDWVELMNIGTGDLDISGYEIRDNSDDHRWKFPEGSKIGSGELLVVDASYNGLIYDDQNDAYVEGTFEAAIGIGSGDSIRIYDKDGNLLDTCSWTEHASYDGDAAKASIGRYPDGKGAFYLTKETKGLLNDWYKPKIAINEIESNDDDTDWVEIINTGSTPIDISGWYLYDNDSVGHINDITPVEEGTILAPGEFYVFDQNKDFTFGLGKGDKVTIHAKGGAVVDEYEWTAHAAGVYARIPDGTGEFIDFETSTKGKVNIAINPVVLNEIQSKDKNGGPDWVELANPTEQPLDISGIVIKDNDDTNEYIVPEGTEIPANGFIVIDDLGFGLGKSDSVRLYEDGKMIASTTWTDHTNPTWGLYPDVNGNEYRNTKEETPGAANKFAGIPDVIEWQGDKEVKILDEIPTFLEDSSGLDFFNGKLYAIDNGTGKLWILDVEKDGTVKFANGFENGKRIIFQKDAGNTSAKGPDTEGITVDGNGMVYAAAERDNSKKDVNYNTVLMVDPNKEGTDLVALKEWNLTDSLPMVSANMGIEAIEWVSNSNVKGKLFDKNTGSVFNPANYPNAVADGVFFVALEDNGHVYAYVLNDDGSSVQIADIDSKLGGAMALDFDTYENVLWVATDNGYNNRAAKITLTGEQESSIVHVLPPANLDITANNEGFAIADASFTVNGKRPVFRFNDGVKQGSLSLSWLNCDYVAHTHEFTKLECDNNNHWYVCECGEKNDMQKHSFGEWTQTKAPTNTEKGEKERICSVCEYKEIEEIPVVVTPENPDEQDKPITSPGDTNPDNGKSDTNNDQDVPTTGDNTNILLWSVSLIASAFGFIGAAFYKKRKYFSR